MSKQELTTCDSETRSGENRRATTVVKTLRRTHQLLRTPTHRPRTGGPWKSPRPPESNLPFLPWFDSNSGSDFTCAPTDEWPATVMRFPREEHAARRCEKTSPKNHPNYNRTKVHRTSGVSGGNEGGTAEMKINSMFSRSGGREDRDKLFHTRYQQRGSGPRAHAGSFVRAVFAFQNKRDSV